MSRNYCRKGVLVCCMSISEKWTSTSSMYKQIADTRHDQCLDMEPVVSVYFQFLYCHGRRSVCLYTSLDGLYVMCVSSYVL